MPTRYATRRVRAFHWLPPKGIINSEIKIDSVSVKTKIWAAEFTRAICPEIGSFKIVLDNNNSEFSEKYSDEEVEFLIDREDGDTSRFKGNIDSVFPPYSDSRGFTVELSGNHIGGELISDIHVTESYASDTTISDILDDLNTKYLTGYTMTYTSTDTTTKPKINWNDKSFWECINDLRKLTTPISDAYVDDDKVIRMFNENSVENNEEALVMGISLISAPKGIGRQSLTKKDKIRVIGEAKGLPVLSTRGTGTKEEVVYDNKVITTTQADELAAAQLGLKNQTPREGEGEAFMMATLTPGDRIWYSNKPQGILEQVKVYRYTQRFPIERTKVNLQTARELPHILKTRLEQELALQVITNPFRMERSWNFVFEDYSELATHDSNVKVEDGKIKLSSGVQGTFTATMTAVSTTKVHLKVNGSALVGTVYKFSTDGGDTPNTLTPESEITVPAGTTLWFKVFLNSADTEIEALALLMR